MPILQIILILVVVGVILWLVNAYVPMPGNYKRFLNIAVIILLVVWLLSLFGLFDSIGNVRIGGR